MKLSLLLASAALAATAAADTSNGVPASAPAVAPAAPISAPSLPARLPGFAATLAQRPSIRSPEAWRVVPNAQSWAVLAQARGQARQEARWDYALSLIGRGRGAEADGVLEVMVQDDPDLALVESYRLAHGVALVQLGRLDEALAALAATGLATNPEACLWRMRALAGQGLDRQALGEFTCARPALAARRVSDAAPFLLASAHAAIGAGKPEAALRLLAQFPDRDAAANILRGRAALGLNKPNEARLRFARAEQNGTLEQRMSARLSQIEADVATGTMAPATAITQLAAVRYSWRGDEIEERALRLGYRLSVETHDLRDALDAGARLFRYFDPARQGPDFMAGLQAQLAATLDPGNGLPLDQAAGLFWDYRDLIPSGSEGDLLLAQLGDRLQAAGLYSRAADLFEHQLFVRAKDLVQGPLSVRVATLHILAGHPDRALAALRRSEQPNYTTDMIQARQRVAAVALAQTGKVQEAFAAIQNVPDASALRAEILWKRHDWAGLVAEDMSVSARDDGTLSEVDQAIVLRRAIAFAMLGREDALADLRRRYGPAFARLKTAPVFDMLTAAGHTVDPDKLSAAMAALPVVSPAGEIAELLDAQPAPTAPAPPGKGV